MGLEPRFDIITVSLENKKMSEGLQQAPVIPTGETGASGLTYASLLEQEDLHPALRPHIERLAAERGDIERSSEITPKHHQRHLEIARPTVPGIDGKTTTEQDFIGEVVELGEEALEAPDAPVETLTPELAIAKIKNIMNIAEQKGVTPEDKARLLDDMTSLLRIMATTKDSLGLRKSLREDSHFQKLGIRSGGMVKNSLDRDLHQKIAKGLGLETSASEQAQIEQYFSIKDRANKAAQMSSFAENGLLTLSSAINKGVLKETSATPGDYGSIDDLLEIPDEHAHTIRGYVAAPEDINDDLFYGRNSFFGVVMERGGEDIDRASSLPKEEVENRARNSMLFVVNEKKLKISSRNDNIHHEDVISDDIPPDAIDYVLVSEENYPAAEEAFGQLPIKVVGVGTTETELHGHWNGPYKVPNYKEVIEQIAASEGPIWCHISRLPLDTYPKATLEPSQT